MSSHEAKVELLTAEVRVLMVGSRQITVSVARQLDWILCRDISPFGRVKLGGDHPSRAVIGADSEGVLSLAEYWQPRHRPMVIESELSGKIVQCGLIRGKAPSAHSYGVRLTDEVVVDFAREALTLCEPHKDQVYGAPDDAEPCYWYYDLRPYDAEIDIVVKEWQDSMSLYRKCDALPLIVLAGLR